MATRYIERTRTGKRSFKYFHDGKEVTSKAEVAYFKSIGVPPAWQQVKIAASHNARIQATGIDKAGRLQYIYHPKFRARQEKEKFERILRFAKALPKMRRLTREHLALPGLPREKVLATIVYLLEATMMRIGNDEYARENKSYGLTTLRNRHVKIDGSEVEFRFRGKSGVYHDVKVHDRRLARIIQRTRDLPGQDLFQYLDDDGETHTVGSADVNDYLRTITGEDYTAKDFRTWSGTVLAAMALQEFEAVDSDAQAKKNVVRAIESVAEKLGNTPSVCRKCYVHPAVLDAYLDGTMLEGLRARAEESLVQDLHDLQPEEAAVLAMLERRLAQETASNDLAVSRRAA